MTLGQSEALDANGNSVPAINPNDPMSLVDLCPQACQIATGNQADPNCLGQCVRAAVLGPQASQQQQGMDAQTMMLMLMLMNNNDSASSSPPPAQIAPDVALVLPPLPPPDDCSGKKKKKCGCN